MMKFFGGNAQVIVGIAALFISWSFWVLGTVIIKGAASPPWHWNPSAFIFHASMFALVVASYAIIATGLGFCATERVESQITE